jgi:twinfilin-like protein
MSNNILKLNFYEENLSPSGIAAKLPTDHPSFTFYRHLESGLTYFIFCSPDSVPVKERMSHTLAIPGLVNIIANENGVVVDQKIEIHDPDELEFGEKDKRIGKFRSLYLRNEFVGTESTWEKMDEAQNTLDSIC